MLNADSQKLASAFGVIPERAILAPREVTFRYVDFDRDLRKPTSLRFLNVDRSTFDAWLIAQLPDSVEVAEGAEVQGIEQLPDRVLVRVRTQLGETKVSCETLVGADGARSVVRSRLTTRSPGLYVTLQDQVELLGPLPETFDCIHVRGIGDGHAYTYVVPKGDFAAVGSVLYPRTIRPHEDHERVLAILRSANPSLGRTVRREAAAALAVRRPSDVMPGAGRVLLAGEAGGFISPTSGEGISYALRTGTMAGAAIAEHEQPDRLSVYAENTLPMARDIARRLRWLPLMESRLGRYAAGFVPTSMISRITEGL